MCENSKNSALWLSDKISVVLSGLKIFSKNRTSKMSVIIWIRKLIVRFRRSSKMNCKLEYKNYSKIISLLCFFNKLLTLLSFFSINFHLRISLILKLSPQKKCLFHLHMRGIDWAKRLKSKSTKLKSKLKQKKTTF